MVFSVYAQSISTFFYIFVGRWVLGWFVARPEFPLAYSFSPSHLIERGQLLMNVCSLLEMLFVTRQVSQPSQRSIDLTLVLEIRILFRMLCAEDLHTDFRLMNACFPFPILTGFDILVYVASCS
ncbi:unnamed protein product [Heterobilharzia americana]|nr:unnamed protein product [Heterobilharzia americana]